MAPLQPEPKRSLKKRLLLWLGLALAVGIILALMHPVVYYTILGLVKREAFYQGRSTGYWTHALKKAEDADFAPSGPYGSEGRALREGRGEAIPVFVEMLADDDAEARSRTLINLNLMRLKSADLVPPLLQLMARESDVANARIALEVVTKIDRDLGLRAATEALQHNDHRPVRLWALSALTGIAMEIPAAVDPIRDALRDADVPVRTAAARCLGKEEIRSVAKAAIPELHRALTDSDPGVRLTAAEAVWHISRESDVVLPVLIQTIRNVDQDTPIEVRRGGIVRIQERPLRLRAVSVLVEIGPPAVKAMPELIEALQDREPRIHRAAAMALGNIGPPAKEAVPILLKGLALHEADFHIQNARALLRITGNCKPALDTLIEGLDDPEPVTYLPAAYALVEIGPGAKEAIPALLKHLNDETQLGVVAAKALWKAGYEKGPILRKLMSVFKEGTNSTRLEAVRTLEEMGPAAKGTLPELLTLWSASDEKLFWSSLASFSVTPLPMAEIWTPLLRQSLVSEHRRTVRVPRYVLADLLKAIDPPTAAKYGIR